MKSMFKVSALIAAMGITTLGVLPAAQAAATAEKATVVLVHGASPLSVAELLHSKDRFGAPPSSAAVLGLSTVVRNREP